MFRKYCRSLSTCLVIMCTVLLCSTLVGGEDDGDSLAAGRLLHETSSEYWLGLYCTPPGSALRAHLGISDGEGLVVRHLVDDGPAAKGGLHVHDVLLKFGDTEAGTVADLIRTIEEVKDQPIGITLVRAGEKQSIEITPERRPEGPVQMPFDDLKDDGVRRWLEEFEGLGRMRFFHPGAVVPHASGFNLPDNLKVSITKQGDQPAVIVVEKDGSRWELTEDELSELPVEIRPHVKRMLGSKLRIRMRAEAPRGRSPARLPGRSIPFDRPNRIPRQFEDEFESMQQQFEQLRRQFDRFRDLQTDGDLDEGIEVELGEELE